MTGRLRRARASIDRLARPLVPFALAGWVALWPHTSSACGSCFLESEATREAYYGTTLLLIAVPVLAAAAIGGWLYRASRRRAANAPTS